MAERHIYSAITIYNQNYLTEIIRKTALHCVETLQVIEEQRDPAAGI
jgi:hypothetical protein